MDFQEMAEAYGLDTAKRQFGLSDHLVIVVHPGKYVTGTCGNWHGSMPLGMGQLVSAQIRKLADAINYCHTTEEILIQDS